MPLVEFKVNIVMPDYDRARLDAIIFLDEALNNLVDNRKILDYSLILHEQTPVLVMLREDAEDG